ncbi:MAG: hypothetical protein ABIR03_01025 [Ginsengibacter sp.]
MHNNRLIKNFFAVLLLVIFALSNTPTKVLHQLFARHTDFTSHTLHNSTIPQLNVAGIDCHCQSNVVITPYTFEKAFATREITPYFATYTLLRISNVSFAQPFTFGLRGPPSVA